MKVVLRLLDPAGDLIGWTEAHYDARGRGELWLVGSPSIVAERAAVCARVVAHLCDLDVRFTMLVDVEGIAVRPAQALTFSGLLVTLPSEDLVLPPVTVGRRTIAVPVGNLTATR